MAYGKSNGHVTLIGQTRDTYTVRVHYRENSYRMLFSNNR